MAPTKVQNGLVVGIVYKVKLEDGEVIDQIGTRRSALLPARPGKLVLGLEKALVGLAVNESKTVKVTPEEGYGEYDEEATEEMERDMFPEDMELEPGLMLTLEDDEGNLMDAVITDIADEIVTLDFNHPLAGETLFFEVKVVEESGKPRRKSASTATRTAGHAPPQLANPMCNFCMLDSRGSWPL